MNSEDIIRMAREAGAHEHYVSENDDMPWSLEFSQTNLEEFAALVAAAEREACARVCDEVFEESNNYRTQGYASHCADAIRARGGE